MKFFVSFTNLLLYSIMEPQKIKSKLPYFIPFLALSLFSCVHPPEPSGKQSLPLDIFGATGSTNFAAVLQSGIHYVENGTYTWDASQGAMASMRDTNGNAEAISGSIILDGDSLSYNGHYYTRMSLSNWDTTQIWDVKDTGNIGSFKDTIMAPYPFKISYPDQLMHHDSVSATGGFTISYTDPGPGTDSVIIMLQTNPFLSHAIDTTISTGTPIKVFQKTTQNNGSYVVTGMDLSGFPVQGVLAIHIFAIHSKITQHSGRQFMIKAFSEAMVNTFIKP